MGVESVIAGLFGLGSAAVNAFGAHSAAAANANAQANLNKQTMEFNRQEAEKARNWQAKQSVIDRQFNQAMQEDAQAFNAKQASAAMNFAKQESALGRKFNAQESLLARQFEERMSSTAHQREVQDLRAAGLNPILSATGGSGASSPVAPILSSPVATGSMAQSSAVSHNTSGGAAASVSGLKAPVRDNILSTFMSSALDNARASIDLKRAEADDKQAEAAMKRAMTDDKRAVQEIEESISRVGLNYDQHELNQIRKRGEEAQAKLYEEKIISEVQERLNKKNVSDATVYNLKKCAEAAGTAAYAQAKIADVTERIQSAESPERIAKLRKEAEYYQGLFDRNKWIMEDPKEAARRKWWRENPEAAHANEMLDIVGNVVHGSVNVGSSMISK